MTLPRIRLRSAISVALAIAVATVFSLNSLAVAAQVESSVPVWQTEFSGPDPSGAPTAMLVSSGTVLLDGNPVRSGTTILSDSAISTTSDSSALVDMGSFGRFELSPGTTVKLLLSPGAASITARSGDVRVSVTSGSLAVASTTVNQQMGAYDSATFKTPMSATLTSEAVFTIDSSKSAKQDRDADETRDLATLKALDNSRDLDDGQTPSSADQKLASKITGDWCSQGSPAGTITETSPGHLQIALDKGGQQTCHVDHSSIVVESPSAGLVGTVKDGGSRIQWSDGSEWTRCATHKRSGPPWYAYVILLGIAGGIAGGIAAAHEGHHHQPPPPPPPMSPTAP